ncbi:hypothetical protein PR002_g3671 [Phytophthora rubi]|uniref:Retrotransposon gag domain-containing protein n=1 Tax=Phytophthora rubi TaxID=129364 RepID=A0A6A3NMN4_9STRA|nr:hypothetical protein PR002_g3671 [Phytophthora rubi]
MSPTGSGGVPSPPPTRQAAKEPAIPTGGVEGTQQGVARERGVASDEGKAAPGMEEMMRLLRDLSTKAIEEGGSLGMHQMHLDELGGVQVGLGVQTPGAWARGGYFPNPDLRQAVPQYQVHRPPPVDARPPQVPMDQPRVPPAKEAKLALRTFDGSEVYKGLGSGFEQWALLFIEQVEMAELAHGYRWAERAKVNKFAEHLRGRAEKYFQQHVQRWWGTQPNLWFIMEQMNAAFRVNISNRQAMKLLSSKKESTRTWNDHFLYLNAVMNASGASPTLVLENVVKYADPELKLAMMAKYDPARPDPLQQASEMRSEGPDHPT